MRIIPYTVTKSLREAWLLPQTQWRDKHHAAVRRYHAKCHQIASNRHHRAGRGSCSRDGAVLQLVNADGTPFTSPIGHEAGKVPVAKPLIRWHLETPLKCAKCGNVSFHACLEGESKLSRNYRIVRGADGKPEGYCENPNCEN